MPRPIRVAQLPDSHLGAGWQRRDPLDTLHLVLDAIAAGKEKGCRRRVFEC